MGSLRPKTIKNMGKRGEPILESRVKEYREHLCKDGPIEAGELVIVGIKGGGLALITSLPEVLEKNVPGWVSVTNLEMLLLLSICSHKLT